MSFLNKKVDILNYGLNNIKSLYSALLKLGANPNIINNWKEIKNADYLILPGVGAFSKGIENLKKMGYYNEIINFKEKDKPFLGICLGMQMLFEKSEEFGNHKGLGIIKGDVKLLPYDSNKKLPNVGWYSLTPNLYEHNKLSSTNNPKYYFNHGYYCEPKNKNLVLSRSSYGSFDFCSSVKDGNIMGSQFHPEKSSHHGLNFLKIFLNT